jgi:hypothetical protein
MTFHDDGCGDPYEGDDENGRCACFDKAIATARAISGGAS